MAEEATTPVEEQEVEEQEPQEEENLETEEQVEEELPEEEPTEETPEEGDEQYYDSEEDYLESLGVGKKSIAELVEEHKQLRQQVQTFQTTAPQFTPQQPSPEKAESQDDFKFLPERGLAKKYIGSLQFGDDDASKKIKSGYEAMANLVDSTTDQIAEQAEKGLQSARTAIYGIMDFLQRQSYKNVKRKDLVPFEQLQQYMLQNGLIDAESAAQRFVTNSNPTLLNQLLQTATKEGEKRGLKKQWKKSSAVRKSKQTSPKEFDWKPYFDREGNRTKAFWGLSSEQRVKAAESFEKYIEKNLEG